MTIEQDQANDLARQEVVNDVLVRAEGRDVPDVAAALASAFQDRGLPVPTDRWLESTAIELAAGRKVVVSAATEDAAASIHPPSEEERGQPPAGVPA
jgi:hypothetical protein